MAPGLEKLLALDTQRAIARRLSTPEKPCSYQHVQYWMKQGYVPAVWAPRVSREFGIPLHELNPEVYPAPAELVAAPA